MRAAVLLLAGFASLSFVTVAEAAPTARLNAAASTDRVDVYPGDGAVVLIHVTGSIECSLPGAPEAADLRLNKASHVDGRDPADVDSVVWTASPSEKSFSWHEAGIMRYTIDESFTMVVRSPASAQDAAPNTLVDVLRWETARQVSSGTNCNRSFDWSIQSAPIELHVLVRDPGRQTVSPLSDDAGAAGPLELQGVSSTPTEAKVVAGIAIALVVVGGSVVLTFARRVR